LARAAQIVIDAGPFIDRSQADCGLQKPIELAAATGGGMVLIPAGTYELRCGLLLRDRVSLVGAGIDKTVLTPARRVTRLEVVVDQEADGKLVLSSIPAGLEVGSALVACEQYPPTSRNDPRPCYVTSLDREMRTVTLSAPYGRPKLAPGVGCLVYGDSAVLEATVLKGDWHILLKSAKMFREGDELTFGAPPNESLLAHAFVHEVVGNRVILKRPAKMDFEAWPAEPKLEGNRVNSLVFGVFPMIHGAKVSDAAISDLTIRGHGFDRVRTMQERWTVAGIHFFDARRLWIERVAVRDWPSDGISLQTGDKCRVLKCEITGVLGSGLHPGTGLTNSVFSNNVVERNGAGLYFCWENQGHVLRYNRFVGNLGGGITGLGNPLDQRNVIRNNYIARNGTYGIEINGGGHSENVIKNNTVENNSKKEPGRYAGIVIASLGDGATRYTISGNTIRDTQPKPTQHVGIEEQMGADENTITGNRFFGHKKANVIRVGPKTVVEDAAPAERGQRSAGSNAEAAKSRPASPAPGKSRGTGRD